MQTEVWTTDLVWNVDDVTDVLLQLLRRLLFQAFGFINLILWVGNLWFVFKETGIIAPFMRAPPPQEKPPAADAYGQQGGYEQDPYASNQGGYQPDYSQQGYNQVIELQGACSCADVFQLSCFFNTDLKSDKKSLKDKHQKCFHSEISQKKKKILRS